MNDDLDVFARVPVLRQLTGLYCHVRGEERGDQAQRTRELDSIQWRLGFGPR
jgi:hypothetical protein